jgi:hypothetical protein
MKLVSLDKLIEEFGEESRDIILEKIVYFSATHIVLFENLDMWASCYGAKKVLFVGINCTHKTVDELEGKHLGDLPSQRMYPTMYAEV